jgi:F-type H+-transporting ATPase subunit a
MILRKTRIVALTIAVVAFVVGVVLSFTQSKEAGDNDVEIGKHVTRPLDAGFWGFNLDTIWTTAIAGGLVLILGLAARAYLTRDPEDHVPSKLQLFWETIVDQVNKQVADNLGKVHPYVAPLAISLFFFILFANWLELLPTEINHKLHLTPAPTADTNLTYALALITMGSVWVYGIRSQGARGYFGHFFANGPLLAPLNIIEELIKPVTLALRLFGNIFAGGIMLSLIALLPAYVLWAPNAIWKLFDMAIGGIQAFIFALLTVLYFSMAAGHGDEHAQEHGTDNLDDTTPRQGAAESARPTPVPAA